jgi:hypothetical protein
MPSRHVQRQGIALPLLYILAGVGGQQCVPVALPPCERDPVHLYGKLVGPRVDLDAC